ncbi:myb-interacting protein 40 [Oratosquilla oratoria]|uniref:myb-interacting protein 40 n=1 Tax=Oratosquilla oratoria TaxID=337810 RepID=UPI003F75D222
MTSSAVRIKLEKDDQGGDVDVARVRFESALQDLLLQDDESDTDNESDSESKTRNLMKGSIATLKGTRPPRKRRRKETEPRDVGFHHTFVMRMFDRSVDLAQFDETSPLYPICRAWMINQPHNSSLNVKQEPESPTDETQESGDSSQDPDNLTEVLSDGQVTPLATVKRMPPPELWEENVIRTRDPRIPEQLDQPIIRKIDEANSMSEMLADHLERWKNIRIAWRNVARENDQRYHKSYTILRSMFDRTQEN